MYVNISVSNQVN